MLIRENCCGNKYRALLTVCRAFKSRTKCDLGFSEADVAAEKSVHGIRLFHIALYFIDCSELIGRFVIFKPPFEIALHIYIRGKCIAGAVLPFRIQSYELIRHILDCGTNLISRFFPVLAADFIQLYCSAVVLVRAYIF